MPHPEKRDLDLARIRLEAFLGRGRPGAEGLAIANLRAPSNTGFSSETLMFEVHWRERGAPRSEKLVARIKPRGFNVFPSYDLTVQFRVMDALAKTGVPVPAMREHDWSDDTLGAPFYTMEFLDGWVPSDNPPMHAAGRMAEDLTPAEREQVWWSGVEAMCRVHDVDPQQLGLGFLDDSKRPQAARSEPQASGVGTAASERRAGEARGPDALAQHLNYYDAYLTWGLGDRARYPLLERALGWLQDRAPAGEPVALCWGDSRLANQIYSGVECIGVLDWEMVRLGNPLQDVAWWVALDRCFSEGTGLARLAGLPGRDETLAHWRDRTGRSLDHVDYYEVFALMKFGAIMARLGRQVKHYGILPPDHDMDVNNLASLTLARKLDELGVPL
ncbi:MAG TPA: phosphotransferase family protein [Myxococcota bacterium]|nr:phosphotransferase family protein [Myxococcota bacterium]